MPPPGTRLLAPLALALLAARGAGQMSFTLTPDPTAQAWTVEGRLANPERGALDFVFPRWTAGAYHLADFGRGVEELAARGVDGEALAVERLDASRFRIAAEGEAEVLVRYRAGSLAGGSAFSNGVIDVEANRITTEYAYVNPPSLFGFVADGLDRPVELRLTLPPEWRAATVLERDETGAYRAPSYFRFEDSPLLLSPRLEAFDFEVDGKQHRVSVHGVKPELAKRVAQTCEEIAVAASALLGGLPYSHYHFLIGFVPEAAGSGLEHSFSTLILLHPSMPLGALQPVVAHELLHAWCGERIHVEALHRPDYTQPLETGTIWVNESITQYLTLHVLLRAGLIERTYFFDALLGKHDRLSPDAGARSLTSVSRAAAREMNTLEGLMAFASKMYGQGPRTMLALDLAMRRASRGEHGVVDLVARLGHDYADQGRGFPEDGVFALVNALAGADLSEFHDRFIDGADEPDPAADLDVLGYTLEDGQVREVEQPDEAQLRARDDFFGP